MKGVERLLQISTVALHLEAERRWRNADFFEQGMDADVWSYDLPWVEYENYMKAQLVVAEPGRMGLLLVDFPPDTTEGNKLHTHPVSDRVVTVLKGSGIFFAVRFGAHVQIRIESGSRIWMPRDVVHTFLAGTEGLTIESVHNPFVSLNDPRCLVYPNDMISDPIKVLSEEERRWMLATLLIEAVKVSGPSLHDTIRVVEKLASQLARFL